MRALFSFGEGLGFILFVISKTVNTERDLIMQSREISLTQ